MYKYLQKKCDENYVQIFTKKIFFSYPTPCDSWPLSPYISLWNRNKIIQIENQLPMNTFRGSDLI